MSSPAPPFPGLSLAGCVRALRVGGEQVKSIAEMGAYVALLEYNGIEGMILLSELSRRRIRSITKLIKVRGQAGTEQRGGTAAAASLRARVRTGWRRQRCGVPAQPPLYCVRP